MEGRLALDNFNLLKVGKIKSMSIEELDKRLTYLKSIISSIEHEQEFILYVRARKEMERQDDNVKVG